MNRKAVEAARFEFNRAWDSVHALETAKDIEQIRMHWATFLSAADRMFNKLKAGTKGSLQSEQWYKTKIQQRHNDPLLLYIWKARNADEHGLEFMAQEQPGFIREVQPTPEEREAFERTRGDRPTGMTGHAVLEITVPHVRLLDVTGDRGATFKPPPNCIKPHNTGMLALSRLEPILQEAEAMVT